MRSAVKFQNVDEYMISLPVSSQTILQKLRKAIKQAAPKAEEVISYNMPAFRFHGMLVFYAAYKTHIGLYPTASAIFAFKKELSNYEIAKGTIRFPLDRPLPLPLIKRIVKFKMAENMAKAK